MTESNSTHKRFKLLSINTVLIVVCVLTFCNMFIYYKQSADNKLIDSLVQEKLLRIDYNNNVLVETVIRVEDSCDELNIRINILESYIADIERRLKIIEKHVKE